MGDTTGSARRRPPIEAIGPTLARAALTLAVAMPLGLLGTSPSVAQTPPGATGAGAASGTTSSPQYPAHITHAQLMRLREMHRAPPGLGGAAQQNRELNQIGNKLLKETPKAPPQDNVSTGGGLKP